MAKSFLILALATLSILGSNCSKTINNVGKNYAVVQPNATETEMIQVAANIAPSERQLRWQRLEYVAFFHFGMNTFTDREWGEGNEDLKLFNPTQLDARQWIKACKEGGMKQVIMVAKHHDGFCLWPTKYTEHSVKNSPWKNGNGDVLKEVSDACHEMGMGFGIYLSPWDRNNPNYGDSPKYNEVFVNQLTELLTNYGKVDEVWFDGACGEGPNGKKQVYDWDAYYSKIHTLAPDAVIAIVGPDVRWVGTESGYGRETEWSVVPYDEKSQENIAEGSQKEVNTIPVGNVMAQDLGSRAIIKGAKALGWYPAETDVSIRPGWFYHASQDGRVKSPEELLNIYFASVGRNSVLLLNIPPDKRGLIHENDVKALKGLKDITDKLFSKNYLSDAQISSDGENVKFISDKNDETNWTTKGNNEKGTITITLKEPATIDVLSLQENITIGQRVEKFTFEYRDGQEWKEATKGTTIGYKRLLRFNQVTSKEFRIKIEASRLNPTVAEMGLYKLPVEKQVNE